MLDRAPDSTSSTAAGVGPKMSDAEKRIIREAIAEGSYCPVCGTTWANCDCDDRFPDLDSDDFVER